MSGGRRFPVWSKMEKEKKNKKYLKGNDMCDPIYSVQSTTWTSYSYSYLLDLGVQNGGKLTDRRRNDV
jgi:hypothetical protein